MQFGWKRLTAAANPVHMAYTPKKLKRKKIAFIQIYSIIEDFSLGATNVSTVSCTEWLLIKVTLFRLRSYYVENAPFDKHL